LLLKQILQEPFGFQRHCLRWMFLTCSLIATGQPVGLCSGLLVGQYGQLVEPTVEFYWIRLV